MWPFKSWPIKVLVWEHRGNGYAPRLTRARRITSKYTGADSYVLEDDKYTELSAKQYKTFYTGENGLLLLTLINPETGDYVGAESIISVKDKDSSVAKAPDACGVRPKYLPANYEFTQIGTASLKMVDEDMRFWLVQKLSENKLKYTYKSGWENLVPYLPLFVILIGMGILWAIASKDIKSVLDAQASIASQMVEAAKTLKSCAMPIPPPAPG